jgi:hypothetical protein
VDKATNEVGVDNPDLDRDIGDILDPDIALVISGHIHLFEAITFTATNLRCHPPQLVVRTGGDHLAEQPKPPTELDGNQVARG